MGGPRQSTQAATGSMWAAASARNLARRLRRQALQRSQAYIRNLGLRLQHLRAALCIHANIEGRIGMHYHNLGEAIGCAKAKGALSPLEVREAKVAKELGDLARHAAFHGPDAAAGFSTKHHVEADIDTASCDSFVSCCDPEHYQIDTYEDEETDIEKASCDSLGSCCEHYNIDTDEEEATSTEVVQEYECVCGRALAFPGRCFDCEDNFRQELPEGSASDDLSDHHDSSASEDLVDCCAEQYPGTEGALGWAEHWRPILANSGLDSFGVDHVLLLEAIKFHHAVPPGAALYALTAPLALQLHPRLARSAFEEANG